MKTTLTSVTADAGYPVQRQSQRYRRAGAVSAMAVACLPASPAGVQPKWAEASTRLPIGCHCRCLPRGPLTRQVVHRIVLLLFTGVC